MATSLNCVSETTEIKATKKQQQQQKKGIFIDMFSSTLVAISFGKMTTSNVVTKAGKLHLE